MAKTLRKKLSDKSDETFYLLVPLVALKQNNSPIKLSGLYEINKDIFKPEKLAEYYLKLLSASGFKLFLYRLCLRDSHSIHFVYMRYRCRILSRMKLCRFFQGSLDEMFRSLMELLVDKKLF